MGPPSSRMARFCARSRAWAFLRARRGTGDIGERVFNIIGAAGLRLLLYCFMSFAPLKCVQIGMVKFMSFLVQIGGPVTVARLAGHFYKGVLSDPLLLPLFKNPDENHAERMAWWLTELLGGPKLHHAKRGGFGVVVRVHQGLNISESQRVRWLHHMRSAVAAVGLSRGLGDEFMSLMESQSHRFALASR